MRPLILTGLVKKFFETFFSVIFTFFYIIEIKEILNSIHIRECELSLLFLYYARINQLLKTMMCNVATFCSHFMVFKILKKLRVSLWKHVSLFTPETLLTCVYDDISSTSIMPFQNDFVEFLWLLNLVTNET